MNKRDSGLFSIVVPLLVIILLFFITIFVVIIPYIRNSLVEKETSKIKHLVEQQIQILDSLNKAVEKGESSLASAQEIAIQLLVEQRYGEHREFYYWITDLQPVLLMHPFRPDLVNTYVGDFLDPKGNYLFTEMVEIVSSAGEGYLEYVWQLPYDSGTLIDKRSFVKLFTPWGWIVGTGFYIDQLSEDIENLFLVVTILSFIVLAMLLLISYYIFRQRLLLRRKNLYYARNFIESEKRYKDLIGRMNEGFVMVDKDFRIAMVNQKFLTMLGDPAESLIGEDFISFVRDESLVVYQKNIELRKKGINSSYEIELRGVGDIWIPTIVSPMGIFNESSDFIGSFAVFTDISDLKKAQRKLEISLNERNLLLKEIHHRVKNNLQIVISLLHLQRMKNASSEFDKLLIEAEARIFSIALVHELLYEEDRLESIGFGEYLDRIAEHLRIEFITDEISIRFENRLPESLIPVNSAAAIGIIYTELIMKFCALLRRAPDSAKGSENLRVESFYENEHYIISFTGIFSVDIGPESIENYFDLNLVGILASQLKGDLKINYGEEERKNETNVTLEFAV